MQNCEEVTLLLCKELDVPVTRTTLVHALLEHPDYPSLLSISDVLRSYGVTNLSLRIKDTENLTELPTTFIVQIRSEKTFASLFALVYQISSSEVKWYNPEIHKKETIPFEKFNSLFTGYVQLFEKSEHVGEKEYISNLKKEKNKRAINNLLVLSIPLLFLLLSIYAFIDSGIKALMPVIYTCFTLVGAATSALLVLYEVDQYNPTLQKVCTGGGKTNCAAILHSKGSKIFGIHWSVIGLSYFMGVLAVLLAGGMLNLALLSAAAWLNVLALPYTVYSIYYQARIVKQWCPMCLTVQVVLVLLFVISLFGGFLSITFLSLFTFLPFIISIGLVFLSVYVLLPALEKAKAAKHYLQSLQRLKHNPQIFEALLAKQKQITEPTEGLGIILGNPDGKYHLIKVCNPYCGPCAGAHPVIDELIENNSEIRLQIIFTPSPDADDYRNKPIKNLLAVRQNGSDIEIKKALDEWYLAEDKDYERFNKLYPYSQEILDSQIPKIEKMHEWCEKVNIEFTPTFFLNNHQLPELYSVADLRYFLSV